MNGIMNGIPPDMTCSKELQQKMEILDKLIKKTFELNNFSKMLWHSYIWEQQSFSNGY